VPDTEPVNRPKPYNAILLFGAPGTGKGTQGQILSTVPGFSHLSTGDMFRGLDKESDLGKEFLKYSTQGLLVPDDFTIRLWSDYVAGLITSSSYDPDRQFLVLDGIPRTRAQAELMSDRINVHAVIHLNCQDREELVKRLIARAAKSGRPDDAKEEVVRTRLKVYDDETKPVLEHYPSTVIHSVEATGTPAEVLQRILAIVAPLQRDTMGNALV